MKNIIKYKEIFFPLPAIFELNRFLNKFRYSFPCGSIFLELHRIESFRNIARSDNDGTGNSSYYRVRRIETVQVLFEAKRQMPRGYS